MPFKFVAYAAAPISKLRFANVRTIPLSIGERSQLAIELLIENRVGFELSDEGFAELEGNI